MRTSHNLIPALLILLAASVAAQPADPGVKNPDRFDAKRPIARELQTDVPKGFTVGAVGDLIISRPLSCTATSRPPSSMHAISRARRIHGTATGPIPACRP
jgi:hypothetical protein